MIYGWVFAERGQMGRLHWHAIVHVSPNLLGQPSWGDMVDGMFQKYGRVVIETYKHCPVVTRNRDTVEVGTRLAKYLTKYVAKDASGRDAWWDFGGFMSGREADAAQLCSAIGVRTAKL